MKKQPSSLEYLPIIMIITTFIACFVDIQISSGMTTVKNLACFLPIFGFIIYQLDVIRNSLEKIEKHLGTKEETQNEKKN